MSRDGISIGWVDALLWMQKNGQAFALCWDREKGAWECFWLVNGVEASYVSGDLRAALLGAMQRAASGATKVSEFSKMLDAFTLHPENGGSPQ